MTRAAAQSHAAQLHRELVDHPAMDGIYTTLVSAYGSPMRRAYRMELSDAFCKKGPTITHFGIIDPAGVPATDRI
jgi:hypothetical protein